MHNAGVPKDIGLNILQDPVVQIAFNQVLNELDIVTTQCNEAHKDLYNAIIVRGSGQLLLQKIHCRRSRNMIFYSY